MRFDWDEEKNASNKRKHGVSFDEAATVFFDENALLLADPDHAEDEERFVVLGVSSALNLLIVCHCYRADDELIRIISARRADRSEKLAYTRRLKP